LGENADLDTARFVRRVALKVKPDQIQELISTVRSDVIPRTLKSQGVRRIYLLRSVKSPNEFVVLSFWDSKEVADAYQNSPTYSQNLGTFEKYLQAEADLTEYDIAAHEVNAENLPPPESAKKKLEQELKVTKGSKVSRRSVPRKSTPKKKRRKSRRT